MEELAKTIEVSRPTLSRFFRDPESVRPGTAAKIRARLADVDYVPNFFATRMNRQSTGLIGVVIPHYNDLFYTSLLQAIEDAALAAGGTIITQCSHGSPEREARAVDRLLSMNVDGALVAPLGGEVSATAIARLAEMLPTIMLDARLDGDAPPLDFVGTDNFATLDLMVDYLCRTGEPPVFFAMPQLNSNSVEREAAFRAAMERRGLKAVSVPVPSEKSECFGWDFEAFAFDAMSDHFASGRYRTATILCANDRLAFGASRAAHLFGLWDQRGGERLRIAGHDDHPLSQYISPPLTTVAQNVEGIAERAMALLERRAGNPHSSFETSVLPGTLKVRQSA
ncbi:LacI family DNA-binding transcriptional regulator [Martelella sp. FOR1707]